MQSQPAGLVSAVGAHACEREAALLKDQIGVRMIGHDAVDEQPKPAKTAPIAASKELL